MKKFFALLLVAVMTVIGVCGCNSSDYTGDTKFSRYDALEEAKQNVVDYYCDKEYVDTLRISYGTETVVPDGDGGFKVTLKGYYYPEDSYGELGDKQNFSYYAGFDENGDIYSEKHGN